MQDNFSDMIEDLLQMSERELSKWELEFVEAMQKREEEGKKLTDPMVKKLEQIWEKYIWKY